MENTADKDSTQAQSQRALHLIVQTPRGVWDQHNPPHAKKKPVYRPSATVQEVIDDARAVFGFIEQDNAYVLLLKGKQLSPQQTLQEAGVADGDLLVLTVQGGNA
jgi:hypothetical protein